MQSIYAIIKMVSEKTCFLALIAKMDIIKPSQHPDYSIVLCVIVKSMFSFWLTQSNAFDSSKKMHFCCLTCVRATYSRTKQSARWLSLDIIHYNNQAVNFMRNCKISKIGDPWIKSNKTENEILSFRPL
jgi:hypothetical protein